MLAGVELDAIEDSIIGRAPADEEQKSALWLYAEVLNATLPAVILVPDVRQHRSARRKYLPDERR